MGADVVIATPGRLIAHLSLGYVDLSRVSYFILDEADRMLDMGFYDDIMQIVKFLPKERQTSRSSDYNIRSQSQSSFLLSKSTPSLPPYTATLLTGMK